MSRSLSVGTCYIGLYVDYLGQVPEANERNNTKALKMTCRGRTDMEASELTSNKTVVKPGELVQLAAKIANSGGTVIDRHDVAFYLSSDKTITATDTLLYRQAILQPVPRNGFYQMKRSVRIPSDLRHGSCHIGVFVDPMNKIQEYSETNNTDTVAVTCANEGPDLAARLIKPSTTTWVANQRVSLETHVANLGNRTSPPSEFGIFLSKDATISAKDTLLMSLPMKEIKPRVAFIYKFSVTIPTSVTNGECYLGLFADHKGVVNEQLESNNTKSVKGWCVGRPDLTVTALTSSGPFRAAFRETVTFKVKNSGQAVARNAIVGVFLSNTPGISLADTYLGSTTIERIGAGETVERTIRLTLPVHMRAGTRYLGVIADAGDRVRELNESNNTRSLRKTAIGHTLPSRIIEWERKFTNLVQSTSFAKFSTAHGGSADIHLTAPSRKGDFYLLLWSSSPRFQWDPLTDFSMALIGSPIFLGWFGRIDSSGYGKARFALPRVPRVKLDAYTHHMYFSPAFARTGMGSNAIRSEVR